MSSAERGAWPSPAPIPIFPLPAVQLFPGALQPLHVFEPRYRALVRHARAGQGLIAMPMLAPGFEATYHERPAVLPVCGVGAVVAHEGLEDGRANILLRGLGRARIVEELPPAEPFRLARLVPLSSVHPPGFDEAGAARLLRLLAEQLAMRLPSGGETLGVLVEQAEGAEALADVLASTVITAPDARQRLLEELDLARRVDAVTDALTALLARVHGSDPSTPN